MLDFKQAVRVNDCDSLDADWVEFVTLARTGTGHKTHYGYLAMMQVYRSQCLHPQLAALLKQIRTLPMSSHPGARVGWDTPCEWLHAAITANVTTHVSDAAIWNYIQQHPFMDTVDKELRQLLGADRAAIVYQNTLEDHSTPPHMAPERFTTETTKSIETRSKHSKFRTP